MKISIVTQRLRLIDVMPELAKEYARKLKKEAEELELIRKGYAAQIKDIDEEEETFVAQISAESRDRDNEVIKAAGWRLENYLKNPVILFCHRYNMPSVGKALWLKKTETGLLSKPRFATGTQLGRDLYYLYTHPKDDPIKFMNAFSVGFIPLRWQDAQKEGDPYRTYLEQELLEYSAVPVPAHPDALRLAFEEGKIGSAVLQKSFKIFIPGEAAAPSKNILILPDGTREAAPDAPGKAEEDSPPDKTPEEKEPAETTEPSPATAAETPETEEEKGEAPQIDYEQIKQVMREIFEEVLEEKAKEGKSLVITLKKEEPSAPAQAGMETEDKDESPADAGKIKLSGISADDISRLVREVVSGEIRRLQGKVD